MKILVFLIHIDSAAYRSSSSSGNGHPTKIRNSSSRVRIVPASINMSGG